MKPYGIRGEHGIALARDFATACYLEAGKYKGRTFKGSAILSGKTLSAIVAADSYDVAYRLFQALLRAEKIRGVTQITIVPTSR